MNSSLLAVKLIGNCIEMILDVSRQIGALGQVLLDSPLIFSRLYRYIGLSKSLKYPPIHLFAFSSGCRVISLVC